MRRDIFLLLALTSCCTELSAIAQESIAYQRINANTLHRDAVPRRDVNLLYPDDYPLESRKLFQEGIVHTLYLVTTNGSVENCQVEVSSGFTLLDQAACNVISARFRFEPAIQNGVPAAQWRRQPVRWLLDRTPPDPTVGGVASGLANSEYAASTGGAQGAGNSGDPQSVCAQIGFVRGTSEFLQCALELHKARQQAEADQRLYQMQLRQREYEEARAAELRAAERRRQRPSIGQILQRFGTGMAQSQSPSMAGAIADGNAALLGMPLSHQNAIGIPTPRPVRPRTVTITTPNGGIVTCTYSGMGNMINCM